VALSKISVFVLLFCVVLPAQEIPAPTDTSGHILSIKKTWVIGGAGNWDYLTADPSAQQLFIAHGVQIQVVDLATGSIAGQVTGLREAHSVALDDSGEFGYASDGPASEVKVFDRRTFKVVAAIATGPSPSILAFEPQNKLLFVVCNFPVAAAPAQPSAGPRQTQGRTPSGRPTPPRATPPTQTDGETKSSITVIDVEKRLRIGEILMPGKLGYAQTDGRGQVFFSVVNRNQIASFDAQAVAEQLAKQSSEADALDWSHETRLPGSAAGRLRLSTVGSECHDPGGLAVDTNHSRLFVACSNMKMVVMSTVSGVALTSLPTGPETGAIAYDPNQGQVYAANGGANGSLTVIRQDSTDSYAVVQNLPTRKRARTLAVNPATGEVYLVTDLMGVKLDHPGNIGAMQTAPVAGSFQVLVIGN
jgi:DNA-binding beta-propeller fold protein YncE